MALPFSGVGVEVVISNFAIHPGGSNESKRQQRVDFKRVQRRALDVICEI